MWFWGAAAKNDIRNTVITGFPDSTELTNYSAKLDAQVSQPNHFNFFYYRGEKVKAGRDAGVSRPPETTWNQGGPTSIYKFEDSHILGPNLFLSGKFAYVDGTFFLTPQGGLDPQVSIDVLSGLIFHNSYLDYSTKRPQYQTNIDGNWYRGSHELKFGFQYRRTPVSSLTQWPGGGTYALVNLGAGPLGLVENTRAGSASSITRTTSVYAGDVIAAGNLTLNLGLRFDHQNGTNEPSMSRANSLVPDIVPMLQFPGSNPDFAWNDLSPRVGVTYRLTDKTIARASYARFSEQLRSSYVAYNNPAVISDIEYYFFDENGDGRAQASELLSATGYSYGIDPENPASIVSPNKVDPDLSSPATQSAIVGLEHELMPNFSVGTSFGYGYITNTIWAPYVGITRDDFEQIGTVATLSGLSPGAPGSDSTTPVYALRPGVSLASGSGQILTNRDGYHQQYWNLDFTATKRLANRWMFRGFVTFQNHTESFDDPSTSLLDPTPRFANGSGSGPLYSGFGAQQDGGIVVNNPAAGVGSRADIFIHSKWSYSVLGLYQFPYGLSAGGTLYGRQGYPNPEFTLISRGALGTNTAVLLNPDLDAVRYDNVHMLDLRVQKKLDLHGVDLTFDVDLFNALNNETILQRTRQAEATDADDNSTFRRAREVIAPRIVRFGLRVQF